MRIDQIRGPLYRIAAPFEGGGVSYLYLLKGDQVALVDTCVADTPQQVLQPALAEIGMALSDVDLILNTHVHLDHTGGNSAAKRASGAPIHIHAGDAERSRSIEAEVEFMNGPFRALGASEKFLTQRAGYVKRMCAEPAGADVVLSDGDVVDLGAGLKLRVVHNPGHTPGSVSYLWESEGVLIAGDAVQGTGARFGAYPYYNDAPNYRRSLEKISGLDPQLLCVSHAFPGGSITNDSVRAGADIPLFLDFSLQLADSIHLSVAQSMKKLPGASRREIALDALAELVYQIPQLLDRELRMPRSAPGTLVAHMDAVEVGSYPM